MSLSRTLTYRIVRSLRTGFRKFLILAPIGALAIFAVSPVASVTATTSTSTATSLSGSLFTDVRIYSFPNSGGWYDFGYLIGASLFLGGSGASS